MWNSKFFARWLSKCHISGGGASKILYLNVKRTETRRERRREISNYSYRLWTQLLEDIDHSIEIELKFFFIKRYEHIGIISTKHQQHNVWKKLFCPLKLLTSPIRPSQKFSYFRRIDVSHTYHLDLQAFHQSNKLLSSQSCWHWSCFPNTAASDTDMCDDSYVQMWDYHQHMQPTID